VSELGVAAPPSPARRLPLALVIACLALVGAAGGIVARVLHDRTAAAPALPAFHGQGVWAAGRRPAPSFVLRDQHGSLVSLASLRGRPVVLTFLDSKCTSECPLAGRELGSIMRRLPAARRPALVVVSVDPTGDTPRSIAHALAKWDLAGAWTVHWLNAPTRAQVARVWKAYRVQVEPTTNDILHSLALYLIDKRGDERTAYLFPFLQSFVQSDLARLATEPA
jgi:cytochrome oxidase Cu insertion factor (SCO1/SenC/PrrC family)